MDSKLFEEEAAFACSGVEYAFRRWSRVGCASPAALAASSPALPVSSCVSSASPATVAVPVVLLHGFAQSSASWGEVAALLLESGAFTSVYALDFAGHGKSLPTACGEVSDAACDKASDAGWGEGLDAGRDGGSDAGCGEASDARCDGLCAYEMEAACEAVRSFVELVARREGAAPVLVGYSMGGRIALECLVRYGVSARRPRAAAPGGCLADRDLSGVLPVSALVLESAGLGPADEAARLALEKRNAAWARRLREEGVASFMDYWQDLPLFESQRALSSARQAAQRAVRLANDTEALARTFEGSGAHRQSSEAVSLAALGSVAAAGLPVLYLAGSLDAKYRVVAQRVAASCGAAQRDEAGRDTVRCGGAGREIARCASGVRRPSSAGTASASSDACRRAPSASARASEVLQQASTELVSQKMAIFCDCGTSGGGISPDSHQTLRAREDELCVSAGHRRADFSYIPAAAAAEDDDAEKVRQIAKNGQETGNKLCGRPSELPTEGIAGASSECLAERASGIASGCTFEGASCKAPEGFSECASDAAGFVFAASSECISGGASDTVFERIAGGFSGAVFAGIPEVVVVEGAGHSIHLEKPEEFARILGCFAAGAGLAR